MVHFAYACLTAKWLFRHYIAVLHWRCILTWNATHLWVAAEMNKSAPQCNTCMNRPIIVHAHAEAICFHLFLYVVCKNKTEPMVYAPFHCVGQFRSGIFSGPKSTSCSWVGKMYHILYLSFPVLIFLSHFSSNFLQFLPHFGLPEWMACPPGNALVKLLNLLCGPAKYFFPVK